MKDKPIKLTPALKKALTILSNTSFEKYTSARGFGESMFAPYHGRKAWLCGGSYLAKMAAKGLVFKMIRERGYYISTKGKELLKQNDNGKEKTN